MSDSDASASGEEAGSSDTRFKRIQEILLGEQIHNFDRRFFAQEERLREEIQATRQSLRARVDELTAELRLELERGLRAEHEARMSELSRAEARLTAAAEEQRAQLGQQVADLGQLVRGFATELRDGALSRTELASKLRKLASELGAP